MGGWLGSIDVKNSDTSSSSASNAYGTRTPILSSDWTKAFGNYAGNMNASGANSTQQTGVDYLKGLLGGSSPVNTQTAATNIGLSNSAGDLANVSGNMAGFSNYLANNAPQSAGTSQVNAQTGHSAMSPYQNDYTNNVVDTTLANYDQNTNNQLNSLRAGRDAGSAFGDRANLSDGQFLNQSDLNRAQTEAQIRNLGFTNAANLGQQDASRSLAADTTNAANTLNNNQFNVGAKLQSNQLAETALNDQAKTILASSGLSQQVLQNVVTAQGINTDAAQALFAAGSITQSQLNDILSAAGAGNGSSYTDNKNATGSEHTISEAAHVGT